MSVRTAEASADRQHTRSLFDLVFPFAFGVVAVFATTAWLAAIAWLIWLPVRFLVGCIFS